LQMWLSAHGIVWPKNVFASGKDLASKGRGRAWKPSVDLDRVQQLQQAGKSLPSIAKDLELAKPRTKKEQRQEGDKLRKRVKKAATQGPPFDALDNPINDLGRRMLGMVTYEEYEQWLGREFPPVE
jgi:hypothetical protein